MWGTKMKKNVSKLLVVALFGFGCEWVGSAAMQSAIGIAKAVVSADEARTTAQANLSKAVSQVKNADDLKALLTNLKTSDDFKKVTDNDVLDLLNNTKLADGTPANINGIVSDSQGLKATYVGAQNDLTAFMSWLKTNRPGVVGVSTSAAPSVFTRLSTSWAAQRSVAPAAPQQSMRGR